MAASASNSSILPTHRPKATINNIDSMVDFYGTCKHCKHYHKNFAFQFSNTAHVRMKCEICTKDMFGLGRADTQYTLTSPDTIPLSHVESGSSLARRGSSGALQPRPRTEQVVVSHDFAQDSKSSQRQQRAAQAHPQSPNAEAVPTENRDQDISASSDATTPTQPVTHLGVPTFFTLPYRRTLLGVMDYVNIKGTGFRNWGFERAREYSVFGWRFVLYIHPPANHLHGHESAGADATATPALTNTSGLQGNVLPAPEDSHYTALHTMPIPPTSLSTSRDAQADSPDSGLGVVQTNGNQRTNHLSHLRRDLALRRQALQQFNCGCTSDCRCRSRENEGPPISEDDSEDTQSIRVRTPPNFDDVPSDPLVDRLTGQRYLGFIHSGSHLDGNFHDRGQSASHDSDSTIGSVQSGTLGQAPTLGSGNSVSLYPGRPRLNERSHSMPL